MMSFGGSSSSSSPGGSRRGFSYAEAGAFAGWFQHANDLWVIFHPIDDGVNFQFVEVPCERHMLLIAERLIAEEYSAELKKCLLDLADNCTAQGL